MSFDPTKYTKSRFVKGSDLLPGQAVVVTISKVYEHRFDQTGEVKPVLDFSDFDQSMVLNKTQVNALISMFGTDVRLWVGQVISLQAAPSNYQGKPTILIAAATTPPPSGGQPPAPATQPPSDHWPTEPPAQGEAIPF